VSPGEAAEEWIRGHVIPAGALDPAHLRPWADVWRVPTAVGDVWFKACGPAQAFEPRLTADLATRWPGLVAEVLAYDEAHAWLLMADAGRSLAELGNPPGLWLQVLPAYAELQRGEAGHVADHLRHEVPDLRLAGLPDRFAQLGARELPVSEQEHQRLRGAAPRLARCCQELAARGVPESIQHDDLHLFNVFARSDALRVLDWGDSSVSHPFASLVVTFRFLEEVNGLAPTDPWFARLRDAYLEPWGDVPRDTVDLAMAVGGAAHAVAGLRQRDALAPADRPDFDEDFAVVLRRALRLLGA
jgi:hypothetical protein